MLRTILIYAAYLLLLTAIATAQDDTRKVRSFSDNDRYYRIHGYKGKTIGEAGMSLYKLGSGGAGSERGFTFSLGKTEVDPGDNEPLSITAFEFHNHQWNNVNLNSGLGDIKLANFTIAYTKLGEVVNPCFGLGYFRARANSGGARIDNVSTIAPYIGLSVFRLLEVRRYFPTKDIDGVDLKGTMVSLRYFFEF